ncbi:MAG TPA: hypothetical protein VFL69_00890 [Marmoricola sp.]|nr:hypothetical protein [Marmoricola sp.]
MSKLRRLPLARWLVPLVAALVFIGGGSAVAAIATAGRHAPAPPPVDQLLADVAHARVDGLSGTIVQDTNLGLPQLPGVGGDAHSSDLQSLVSGSHTLRVWYAGPKHVRLSLLGHLGESDVIRNGQDLWVWSSSNRTAVHRVLPDKATRQGKAHQKAQEMGHGTAPLEAMTPQGAARMLLRKVDPTTKVTTGPDTTVAGRPAWQLVVTPRSHTTLVGSIRVAIDTATHLPLQVQVFARGASAPAFDAGYTSFDPTTPSMSVFGFNPPAGTKVKQETGPLLGDLLGHGPGMAQHQPSQRMQSGRAPAPKLVGSGWDTVVIAQAPQAGLQKAGGQLGAMLKTLPEVSGPWGSGHLLQGTLFSVLLTDSGQVVAGAVPPAQLYAALGQQ